MNASDCIDRAIALLPGLGQKLKQLRSSPLSTEQQLLLDALLPMIQMMTETKQTVHVVPMLPTSPARTSIESKMALYETYQQVIVELRCLCHRDSRHKLDIESAHLVETVQVTATLKYKSEEKALLHVEPLDLFIWLSGRQFLSFAWHKAPPRGTLLTETDLNRLSRSAIRTDQRKFSLLVSLFRQSPCFEARAENFLKNNTESKKQRKRDATAMEGVERSEEENKKR